MDKSNYEARFLDLLTLLVEALGSLQFGEETIFVEDLSLGIFELQHIGLSASCVSCVSHAQSFQLYVECAEVKL
jgi:hypothetical protein